MLGISINSINRTGIEDNGKARFVVGSVIIRLIALVITAIVPVVIIMIATMVERHQKGLLRPPQTTDGTEGLSRTCRSQQSPNGYLAKSHRD
jgi:hypothetical protein